MAVLGKRAVSYGLSPALSRSLAPSLAHDSSLGSGGVWQTWKAGSLRERPDAGTRSPTSEGTMIVTGRNAAMSSRVVSTCVFRVGRYMGASLTRMPSITSSSGCPYTLHPTPFTLHPCTLDPTSEAKGVSTKYSSASVHDAFAMPSMPSASGCFQRQLSTTCFMLQRQSEGARESV